MLNFLVHSDKTDVGRVRSANEDFHLIPDVPNHHCYIVCDGMGGHVGGATASKMAASVFAGSLTALLAQGERVSKAMDLAIRECNAAVYNRTLEEPELKGMGTTIVALVVDSRGEVHVGHVGDSRIYRFRGGQLQQVTRDDSYVQDLIDRGELREEDREKHPDRSRITKAIGIDGVVEPTVRNLGSWQPGDRVLLCSDGLTGVVEDDELAKEARTDRSQAVDQLLGKALMAGAPDNVTLIMVEAEGTISPQISGATAPGIGSFLTRTDWFAPNWAWLLSGGLSLAFLLVFTGPSFLDALNLGGSSSAVGNAGISGVTRYVCLDTNACNYFNEDTVGLSIKDGGRCNFYLNPCLICEGDSVVPGGDTFCIKLNEDRTEVLTGKPKGGSWVYYEVEDSNGFIPEWVPDTIDFEIQFEGSTLILDIRDGKIVSLKDIEPERNNPKSGAVKSEPVSVITSERKTSVKDETRKKRNDNRDLDESSEARARLTFESKTGVVIFGYGMNARFYCKQENRCAKVSTNLNWSMVKSATNQNQTMADADVYSLGGTEEGNVVVREAGRSDAIITLHKFPGMKKGLGDVRDFTVAKAEGKLLGITRTRDKIHWFKKGEIDSEPLEIDGKLSEIQKSLFAGRLFLLQSKGEVRILIADGRSGGILSCFEFPRSGKEPPAAVAGWNSTIKAENWVLVHNDNGVHVSFVDSDGHSRWNGELKKKSPDSLWLDENGTAALVINKSTLKLVFAEKEILLEGIRQDLKELSHVAWLSSENGRAMTLSLVFEKGVYTTSIASP